MVDEPSQQRYRRAQQEAGNETVEEVIGDIGNDRFVEYLLPVKRKETLERQEDDAEEYQPYADPQDRDEKMLIEDSAISLATHHVAKRDLARRGTVWPDLRCRVFDSGRNTGPFRAPPRNASDSKADQKQ